MAGDETDWSDDNLAGGTGPRVWVTLPDQQELVGQLLEQRQGSTGTWLCMVSVAVWEHAQLEGRDIAQATSIVTPVPASHVERIEGEHYDGITTRRHPAPRPSGAVEDFWYLQRIRGAGELRYLHHARCFCPGDRKKPLDAERAREELQIAGTVPCSACHPENDLPHPGR